MRILCLTLVITLCSACSNESQPAKSDEIKTTVSVTGGQILGNARTEEHGLKEYLGIPYAAAPLGKLRWHPPQPVTSWSGVLDATSKGLPCMQPTSLSPFYDRAYSEMSEDCLTLNVWTRAENESDKLPVMVWIHGGALVMGSGADYDGAVLSAKGVIVVTINYRLGPFGFFAHPELSEESPTNQSGNQGYRDQIAALKWVQSNIAAFGGDPDNVTIFGESAGSWSVSVMQASPLSRGLFHKVIGQSGARFIPLPKLKEATHRFDSAEDRGVKLGGMFTGEETSNLASLRKLTADQIITTFANDPELLNNFDTLTIVDGDVLPEEVDTIFANSKQADVPTMVGSNALEASTFDPAMFVPPETQFSYSDLLEAQFEAELPEADAQLIGLYPATTEDEARASWVDFNTDFRFTQPMNLWAEYMTNMDSPAYLYWWDWQPGIEGSQQYGAFHAAEVAYVFGDLAMFSIDSTEEEKTFANTMMDIWTQFAKTGNPSTTGIIEWPAYTSENQETAILGADIHMSQSIRANKAKLITEAINRER